MTESQFTARLLRALRAHPALRDAVIWKLNDRTTKGIPDFVIVEGSMTLWCEVKVASNMPDKIQMHWLKKLRRGAALICASSDGTAAAFTSPIDGKSSFVTFDDLLNLIVEWF